MSKEVDNMISLVNKGNLPPLNKNETFGINTFKSNSSNTSEIKKEAHKEILKSLDDKLCDCAIMSDGEYCGYYCSDIRDILRELEEEYEIRS